MTHTFKAIGTAGVVMLVFTCISRITFAAEPGDSPSPETVLKALEEAAKPGPEHEKLEPLAGEFTYTSKFWMDPSQPPLETTGTIHREWILGDRFLQERVTGKGPDGKDFEGRGVIGYDNAQKKYTYGWICTMGTGISTGEGTANAAGTVITFNTEAFCPLRNRVVEGRDELRIQSDDKHVMEMYQIEDGKEVKMMELTAVRK